MATTSPRMHRANAALLFLLLLIPRWAEAQEASADTMKFGLVLSGGGAKGLAHIGVLKVLEEEGLRPDVITGTSMGSLVGGLYAAGLSAQQIEELVTDIRWDDLLTNKIPLDRIAMEEKPYYGRYLVELPFDGLKPKLPSGLIRGQKIDELFRRTTLTCHGTTSFDSLPIPFACMATDVGNGRALLMREGLLPDAMRASMAIPTVFTPLMQDSLLLVDGGAMRNFPVIDAKMMGADLIIGVQVGDGLEKAEDLHNAASILTQAALFQSLLDDPNQVKLCDLFLHPDLTGYSTGSFYAEAVPVLIKRGYDVADAHRAEIRAIAARLPASRRGLPPPVGIRMPDSLRVDRLEIITDRKSVEPLIRGRLRTDGRIAVSDLEKRIDLLYGSLNFDLINYRVDRSKGDSALVVKAVASARERFGLSLNFDNFNQASAGVLLVSRDRIMKGSRLLVESYIGRYPSVEGSLLKYAGASRRLAVLLGGHFARGPFFLREPGENDLAAEMRYDRYGGYLRFQTASSVVQVYGAELALERSLLVPRVGSEVDYAGEDTVSIDLDNVDRLRSQRWGARAFGQFNNTERPIYPRHGWKLSAMAGYFWDALTELQFSEDAPQELQDLDGGDVRLNEYDDFQRLHLQADGLVPMSRRLSAMVGGNFAISSETNMAPGDLLLVGGIKANGRESVPFWGLSEYQETLSEFGILRAGVQWELAKDLFWQVQGNGLFSRLRKDPALLVNGGTELFGGGTTLGLRTGLGIVQVGAAGNFDSDEVMGYFNFGFRL